MIYLATKLQLLLTNKKPQEYMKQNRFLVHFKVEKVLPLIGDKE